MSDKQKDDYFANDDAYKEALANEQAVTKQWGMGGGSSRALNAVTLAVTGALGGQTDIQVVTILINKDKRKV